MTRDRELDDRALVGGVEGDWQVTGLFGSPTDGSLSGMLCVSQGRAAIHRSNQLHPQCGLFESRKVGFGDFVLFFHICCLTINQKE
ncbi:hypothetical protein Hanom_Chr07g00670171 [Helianthus anomalus]